MGFSPESGSWAGVAAEELPYGGPSLIPLAQAGDGVGVGRQG